MSPEEKKAIKALKALEKIWPPSLWVFCSGGSLNVLRVGDRGERVMDKMGNVEQDNVIASFDIPNDGGDW
ncbi:hypothetical protein F9K96_06880 [Brucella anthropi]|uniref:hypothetical protein n=1 Tax=Brucella anthropi TaxID=529 RepID=UPI00124C71AE|nr:hypothetical protein [Brucella anthropi]KAB2792845.1 hypothetical protein F9K96_06880 [Brucella anthropi]